MKRTSLIIVAFCAAMIVLSGFAAAEAGNGMGMERHKMISNVIVKEPVIIGSQTLVTWKSKGVSEVTIALNKDGKYIKNLIWNIPNTGKVLWVPDLTIQPGNNYQIVVTEAGGSDPYIPAVSKESKKFSIVKVTSEMNIVPDPESPKGLAIPAVKQLVAVFDVKNIGSSDASLQKIFLTRSGNIGERLATTDRPYAYIGDVLVGTGSDWSCAELWCVSLVEVSGLIIPPEVTKTLGIRVDTDHAQTGDTFQVSVTEIFWNDVLGDHNQQIFVKGGLLEY